MKKDADIQALKLLVGLVVVLLFLNVIGTFQISGKLSNGVPAADNGNDAPAPSAPSVPTPAPTVEASADDDAVKGDADAPVTIIEFSDYECPFCGRFYSQTLPQIEENYIKTGKVKMVFRDFPLSFHAKAQKAAEAAECAGEQGKYWEMHDALFDNQQALDVPSLKQYAADLGLNTGDFDSCLDSGAMADEVKKDMTDGTKYGVTGTPGFFVNGQKVVGAQPYSVFEQIIEAELQ